MSDLEAAWERVRENEGCAGADGVTLGQFGQKLERELGGLLEEVHGGVYRPLPLLRILIEKTPGSRKTRTLLVPCVRDRVLQTAVARQMSRSYEEEFLEVSFAYRPGRGVDRAIARLRQLRDLGFEYVLDADIKAFFDSVSFAKLEGQLMGAGEPPWILSLVSAWLRIPAWDGKRLRYRSRGLPQGSPLSPLLANLFLYPLDTGLGKAESKLVRYADDFLVLAQDREGIEAAREETERILGELDLELNAAKTRITSFSEGFRFLGVYFQKDEIWQPWKDKPRSQGRLLALAKPMSEAQLRPFRLRQPDNAWTAKFQQAGARWVGKRTPKTRQEERPVAYLYLTQQGSVLRKSGDRFLVELDDKILLDLPYDKLEHVLLFGQVQVTTQAIGELLEKGVDLSYFSWRGQFRGSLTPPRSTNIQDRLAQLDLRRRYCGRLLPGCGQGNCLIRQSR